MLRSEVWRLGLRYLKHARGLAGKPDLVFRRARVVVFCDGDFWHGRDWPRLRARLKKRHNAAYWVAKIARNIQRDLQQTAALEKEGWLVVRLWETDIKRDPGEAARHVRFVVEERQQGLTPTRSAGICSPGG